MDTAIWLNEVAICLISGHVFVSAAFIMHADTWISCKTRDQPLHIRQDLGFTLDVSLQIPFGDLIHDVRVSV